MISFYFERIVDKDDCFRPKWNLTTILKCQKKNKQQSFLSGLNTPNYHTIKKKLHSYMHTCTTSIQWDRAWAINGKMKLVKRTKNDTTTTTRKNSYNYNVIIMQNHEINNDCIKIAFTAAGNSDDNFSFQRDYTSLFFRYLSLSNSHTVNAR